LTSFDEGKKLLSENNFDSMPVDQRHEKSFDAETRGGDVVAKLKAKLPLNPFGIVSGLAIAMPGEVIAGCESPRFTADGSQAGAALNPNGYFFVTAPKETEVQSKDGGLYYEATLTAFITDLLPGDPEGRIKNLLETIEQSDIWSEFAGVLTAKPVEKSSKNDKSEKEKKGKKAKTEKVEESKEENDPWGIDSDSASYKPTSKSDSSSQSKSSEKSKPATPPPVDEDDPWA
jgi:hypothetical protein